MVPVFIWKRFSKRFILQNLSSETTLFYSIYNQQDAEKIYNLGD